MIIKDEHSIFLWSKIYEKETINCDVYFKTIVEEPDGYYVVFRNRDPHSLQTAHRIVIFFGNEDEIN